LCEWSCLRHIEGPGVTECTSEKEALKGAAGNVNRTGGGV